MKTTGLRSTRWAPLLTLTAILAACEAGVTPGADDAGPRSSPASTPTGRQATCADSAIRLSDRGAGIHGAIVADTLHMGGDTAPATCLEPANQSLLTGLSMPDGRTEQAQQSRYYLIVIRYPGGNRLYVLSRRADGTSCVVDTNDQCIARVTDLPDDFDLKTLPDDVAPTIPAGRPAPPTVGPAPGGDDTPPAPGPAPGGGDAPPAPAPPPGDGAPPPAAGTPPEAADTPQPSDGATGVTVGGPLLTWAAAPRALSYDVYWGATKDALGTPINTAFTFLTIAASADLDADTLYYWRVDAKNEAGTTRGNVWSFTTAATPPAATGTPPGAVSNPSPSDGAIHVPIDLLLSWDAAPGARSYDVYWGLTEGTVTALTLTDGGSGYTSAPEVWIEGISEATRATATATVAGGAVTALTVTNGGSYTYRPYVSIRGGGGRGARATAVLSVADPDGTTTNTSSTSLKMGDSAGLSFGWLYSWRVDAKNEAGVTRGKVWSFTVESFRLRPTPRPGAPPAPRLVPVGVDIFNLSRIRDGVLRGEPDYIRLLANPGTSFPDTYYYRIGQVVIEKHRLEIRVESVRRIRIGVNDWEVTPITSADIMGRYYAQFGNRFNQCRCHQPEPDSWLFAFSEARFTPGNASSPARYEWSSSSDTYFPWISSSTASSREELHIWKTWPND